MLHMLEWLCNQLMEREWPQVGADKHEQSKERKTAAATAHAVLIQGWEQFISWFQKSEMAVTFHFL